MAANTAFTQVQTPRNIATSANSGGFYEYLPQGYETSSGNYPLIVFIHGLGELGNGTSDLGKLLNCYYALPRRIQNGGFPTSFSVGGQTHRFIVISPQFKAWPTATDVNAVVDYAANHYRVDQNRIYVTGLSMGGGAVWDFAGSYPNKAAAVVPVCGARNASDTRAKDMADAHLPIWATHNESDGTVSSTNTKNWYAAITKYSGNMKMTIFPVSGHDAWTKTYDPSFKENNLNIYEWMLQHQKGASSTPAPNQTPTANAGADQTINLPLNSIRLAGTGTDADGTISKFQWSKTSGPASASFSSAANATTDVTNLQEGTYVFRLTVTDNQNAVSYDEVTILVKAAPVPFGPGRIEAEDWSNSAGVQTETTKDTDGRLNVGWIENGDWMEYLLSVPAQGAYTLNFRIAAPLEGGTLQVKNGSGNVLTTVAIPATGGFQTWKTITTTITLPVGTQTIRLQSAAGAGWNINWWQWQPVQPNKAPVVSAGNNQNIALPANSVSLSASATDSDGTIVSKTWSKTAGPSGETILAPNELSTSILGLVQGTYEFTFTATDDQGASASSKVVITVNPPINQLPIANAGADIKITLPTNEATLNGSGSDPDGTIKSFLWKQTSGPSTATFQDATSATSKVFGLVAGDYVFQLTVTDNSGATASAQVTVTVLSAPVANKAPKVYAGTDQVIQLPVNTTSIQATATDEDGQIAAFTWKQVSGPAQATILTPVASKTGIENLTAGTYIFEMVVKDNAGATAKDSVIILVKAAANLAPNVNAGTAQTITLPQNTASLSGTATDVDGTIKSLLWTQAAGPSAATFSTPGLAVTSVENLQQGTYTFVLTATDNQLATAADTVVLTVRAASNKPPSVSAGGDKSIVLPVNKVLVTATATDEDGQVTSYAWKQIFGPSVATIVSSNAASTDISALVVGTYSFEILVKDNAGAMAKDTVAVSVRAVPNKAPQVNAGNNQTITLPLNFVALQGTALDEDGTITAYNWRKRSGPAAFTLASASTAATLVTGLDKGTYVFEFTATDNKGAATTATVSITVHAALPPPNRAPVANVDADITITLPVNTAILSGVGSDPDGTIQRSVWTMLDGPSDVEWLNASEGTATATGLKEGTYSFQFTVWDNQGATASDTLIVLVKPDPRKRSSAMVYPNPVTTGSLYVKIDAVTNKSNSTIRIFNAQGNLVYAEAFVRSALQVEKSVDISSLKKGVYFLSVTTDINSETTIRFIKQ
jgi:dienelactone hydrolase